MKVGIVCHSGCDGAARMAIEMAMALSEHGHQVHVFTETTPFFTLPTSGNLQLHTARDLRPGEKPPVKTSVDWDKDLFTRLADQISKVILNEGLHALHIHYALPFVFLADIVRAKFGARGPRMICTLHGTDVSVYARDIRRRGLMCIALKSFNSITTVSENYADLALANLRLERRPVVIPDFVDVNTFCPVEGRRKNFPPRLLHVSNFSELKDSMMAARIFVAIRKKIPLQFCLLGDGEGITPVMDYLDETGRVEDTWLFGCMRDPSDVYRQADVLLMTSLEESFCLPALEAQACGVPVVSSRVGGVPDVVMDGITGFLYTQSDLDMAILMTTRLLTDWSLHDKLANVGRKWAHSFEKEKIMARYERVYSVLGGRTQL